MSSFDDATGIPRSRDGAPNWAADTDRVGPPLQKEEGMSTAEFGDPTVAPAPAPAPDALVTPLTVSPAAPVEPLVQAPPTVPPQPVVQAPPTPPPAPVAPVSDMRDVPLGTLIFRAGLLTEEQLEEALQDGMQRGKRLGEVLLERGLVSESDLGKMLAGQKGLQFVELDSAVVDPSAVALLPVEKARLHSVLPIGFQDGLPVVAVADPTNDLVTENVRRALNCEPHLVVAGREALHRQIELAYAGPASAAVEAAAPAPAPPAVVAPQPVAPVVAPEPVAAVMTPTPPVAQPLQPPVAAPVDQDAGDGIWLGTPQPAVQPEPVAPPVPQLQPLVVEPVAVPVERVAQPQPVEPVAQPQPVEPVAAPFTPAEPVAPQAPEPQPLVAEPVAAPVPPQPQPVEPIAVSPVEPIAQPVVQAPAPPPVVEPLVVQPQPLVAPEPPPAVEPVAPAPAPVVEQPVSEEADDVVTWTVVLRLVDGDRYVIGAYHSNGEAKEFARNLAQQLAAEDGWPFFEGRFIRPDAIVSIDLVEPEGRWLGSAARRAWSSGEQAR